MSDIRTHSKTAWDIASRYSSVLASETRDLAAAIDVAIGTETEGLVSECFALAAGACHGGRGDEGGNWRCNYQDEIERLRGVLEGIAEYWNGSPDSAVNAIETVVERAEAALSQHNHTDSK